MRLSSDGAPCLNDDAITAGGYSYAVFPVTWTNRQHGTSKLKLNEMGGRYAFIVLYVWLEHHLSRGDYRRNGRRSGSGSTA